MRLLILLSLLTSASFVVRGQEQKTNPVTNEIYFLTERVPSADDLAALAGGTAITLRGGCLRMKIESGNTSHAIVWPPGFKYEKIGGTVHILNSEDQIVAKVGDSIRVSGGALPQLSQRHYRQSVPGRSRCKGPFWLANNDVMVIAP